MGADFVSEVIPVTKTREEALAHLQTLSHEELIEKLEYTVLGFEWDEDYYVWEDEKVIGIRPDILLPEIERCVEVVYDALQGLLRDAGWYRIDDCTFVVAGGLSWGDAPENVSELCVVKELGLAHDSNKKLTWTEEK